MSIVLVALAVIGAAQAPPSERIVDERSGLPVIFVAESQMFPSSWIGGQVNGKAESLDQSQFPRASALIGQALSAYPKQVLTANLAKVYVLKRLAFYGLDYGGTNSLDNVYLTVRTAEEGYTGPYVIGSFHHEFSSVLLRKNTALFDESHWRAVNDPSFKYGRGGTDALRQGKASTRYDDALADQGLLTEYSQASLEEDFNMMAEGLMSGDPDFWRLVAAHPKLKQKAALAIEFYSKLDSQFTEPFFRARKRASDKLGG